MQKNKKLTMEEMIKKLDSAKKVNPLDLSSDQDLSIALMNLISLEEHFFFSGGKTEKTGFYDLIEVVREMRKELMEKVVKKSTAKNGEVWCISKHLLAASMRVMEVGTKALGAGKKEEAYALFDKAYELYSLFWGINMELIDLDGVKKITGPESNSGITIDFEKINQKQAETLKTNADDKHAKKDKSSDSITKRLGRWVRDAVDCCIE